MCGIAGIIDLRDRVDFSALERASGMLEHRGPDDDGFFIEGPVGLAHRRLSIIDLSGGSQPFFNEDRTLVLVFNGEIYNFKELRHELEIKGHTFSSLSDTEVILHGFEEWGTQCVERFHGMFTFALYNRKDKSLFLSRDQCGEKPLYFFHENGRFFFASEIQSLITLIKKIPSPDPEAIYLYLRLGYIPSTYSFYNGIKKLQAGSCIKFKNNHLQCWSYYTPHAVDHTEKISENELCDELDETLYRAVKKMLVSDVPLGAFLSGGLDSSLIVAMMAKGGASPKTFSISFDDVSFDESYYALLASEHIGTQHINYNVAFDDFDFCLSIMKNFGEPFADSSGIPTYYLSKETRKKVTVALSGDGADELFGGYRRYLAQGLVGYYLSFPLAIRKGLIQKTLALFPEKDSYYADSLVKSARIFTERAESIFPTPGLMLNMVFSHNEVEAFFPDLPDGRGLIKEYIGEIHEKEVEALMRVDRILYLPDDILVKVDRMSMKNSLEVRAPYLDSEVLALSERIPLSLKIRGKNLKYLLKKVALRYLPTEIVHREKHGFTVPMSQWIKKAGEKYIRSRIPYETDPSALDSLISPHFKGRLDNSHKIFALIMLGCYLNTG